MSTTLKSELEAIASSTLPALAPVLAQLEKTEKTNERTDWDASYKLRTQPYPWSCTLEEGLIMEYVIAANGLKLGFEIATAFGFSALFLGRGLRENGGRLISLDCYVEEVAGSFRYTAREMRQHLALVKERVAAGTLPDCLAQARESARAIETQDNVDFAIGVSPEDVAPLLRGRTVDVALIDGGHFENQPTLDFRAVQPFLAEKCAVFFHDNNENQAVEAAIGYAMRALKTEATVLNTYYSLTVLGRGLDPATMQALSSYGHPFVPKPEPPLSERIVSKVRRLGRKIFGSESH